MENDNSNFFKSNMKEKEQFPNMGDSTSRVFRGEYISNANKEMYAETAEFFADEIKKRLPLREEPYVLIDVGSFQGELLGELLKKMPGYKFQTIALDINEVALGDNQVTDKKIVADAGKIPLADKSVDVVIVRYMLQWNYEEKQKKILQEIARVVKEFALVEHVGADIADTDGWRKKMDDLLDGEEIPKMKRGEHFFSSKDEIEAWLKQSGITSELLKNRKIKGAADVYIERFGLNTAEAEKVRSILADKNYFLQTDWIIYPQEK